ncbi:hypothetical protein GGG16DRAFT_66062 [Schizophyllum commune]
MSCSPSLDTCPSLDACPGLDASPARTTPKRTVSDITVAAAKEGHTPLDHESPPRKRQKTEDGGDQATSASNLGAPSSALLDLPLDVLLEILTHVDPMSLRLVSRTSRALRDTLTGPRSNWIWRASYANTDHGLPPAPDDMTVPQFLSLLVDRVCDLCHACPGSEYRVVRAWAARIKCCTDCCSRSEQIICEKDMDRLPKVREIQGCLGNCYPLDKVLPALKCYPRSSKYYARVHIERLAAEFALAADKKAWIIQREKDHERVIEHARICECWDIEQQRKRQKRVSEIREERVKEITRKMRELETECDDPAAFKDDLARQLLHGQAKRNFWGTEGVNGYYSVPDEIYDLIHKCERLSDGDWIPIRAWLLHAVATSQRRKTLKARYLALKDAYHEFLGHWRCEDCTHPGIGDLVTFGEVTDLIEGTPVDQHLTRDDMHALIGRLSTTLSDAWLASCQSVLVDKLNAADPHRARPFTVSDLCLATAVFDDGGVFLSRYPGVLRRSNFFWSWPTTRTDPNDPQCIVRQRAWSAEAVIVKPDRLRLAARLVTLAGLDPMTTTTKDMQGARYSPVGESAWSAHHPHGITFEDVRSQQMVVSYIHADRRICLAGRACRREGGLSIQ